MSEIFSAGGEALSLSLEIVRLAFGSAPRGLRSIGDDRNRALTERFAVSALSARPQASFTSDRAARSRNDQVTLRTGHREKRG